jgi:putative hydrolase of the HAD superfamily
MAIKNIIFDLGGVILDIDYQKTIDAFKAIGFEDFDQHYTQAQQSGVFDALETGKMTQEAFVVSLQTFLPSTVADHEIISAWNALLLPWDETRLTFVKHLKSNYNLFLFSNTNAIHKAHFDRTLTEQTSLKSLDDLFLKAYYSHSFGHRKPHPESFQLILNENNLKPEETLFIDDSVQHIEGARQVGLTAIHLVNQSILDLNL